MNDRNSGGRSTTRTLRRLGWLGAMMLLAGALLIPGATASAAGPAPRCGCHTTTTSDESSTTTTDESTTSSTQTTETSDVSETTETTSTSKTTVTTTTDGTTNTETGGVGGETGTPDVTPPSTSSVLGTSGSGDGWRVILLVLAGIAVLSLVLLPSPRESTKR